MNKKIAGTIYVFVSAILFALGGLLIKLIPWGPITIQGGRSIFSLIVIGLYMFVKKRKLVINKSVILGAVFNLIMALTFVAATKLTTAANAIVLQFTEPIFIILLMWIIYKVKPQKEAIITCFVVFGGIICFFFDSLSAGGMFGNILAIISGIAYAFVFLIKKFPGADFESSIILSNIASIIIGIPFYYNETEVSISIWIWVVLLGAFQCGISYLFLSKGLDFVSPVTASLASTIEPVINPILVALFYGETIGILAIIGAVLVVGAATLYSLYEAKRKKE